MSQPNIHYEKLQENDIPQLVDKISQVMDENDSHNRNVFGPDYWNWNYKGLMGAEVIVYVAKNDEGEIIGHYHFIILNGHYPDPPTTKYTLIQDAGVDPRYRNLGIFKTLSLMGKAELKEKGVKIIETFPNVRSKHSFSKNTKYTIIDMMPSFVLFLDMPYFLSTRLSLGPINKLLGNPMAAVTRLSRRLKKDKQARVEASKMYDEQVLDVYAQFADTFTYGLVKDANYLQWRYVDKPGFNHYFFKITDDQNVCQAVAVIKEDHMLGADVLVLLDFAHRPGADNYLLQLLDEIRVQQKSFFDTPKALMFTTFEGHFRKKIKKAGFVKVPERLNPRVIPLMVSNTDEVEGFYDPHNWQVCLCDWDVL